MKKTRTPFVVTLCNYGTFEDVSPLFRHCLRPPFFLASFFNACSKKEMNTKSTDIFQVKRDFSQRSFPLLRAFFGSLFHLQGEAKKLGERECSLDFFLLRVVTPFDDPEGWPCFFFGKKNFKNRGHEGAGPLRLVLFLGLDEQVSVAFLQDIFPMPWIKNIIWHSWIPGHIYIAAHIYIYCIYI